MQRTRRWIAANPDGYAMFQRLARERARLGMPISIGQITEVVRWEMDKILRDPDATGYKIPNAYRRYIAIQLMRDEPGLRKWFTTTDDLSEFLDDAPPHLEVVPPQTDPLAPDFAARSSIPADRLDELDADEDPIDRLLEDLGS
jgi:hypothetical protein